MNSFQIFYVFSSNKGTYQKLLMKNKNILHLMKYKRKADGPNGNLMNVNWSYNL